MRCVVLSISALACTDYDGGQRLRPMSYSKSHVILIAFAIDTPDSLDNVSVKVRLLHRVILSLRPRNDSSALTPSRTVDRRSPLNMRADHPRHPRRVQIRPPAHHPHALIHLHFKQWDYEKYANISTMLYNNYRQALEIIAGGPSLQATLRDLDVTEADLRRYDTEEREYFTTLEDEDPKNLHAIVYVETLKELSKCR